MKSPNPSPASYLAALAAALCLIALSLPSAHSFTLPAHKPLLLSRQRMPARHLPTVVFQEPPSSPGSGEGKPKEMIGREQITRENDPDDFYLTRVDQMSDKDRARDPGIIGVAVLIAAPFIFVLWGLASGFFLQFGSGP
mmetsp:Transcript_5244/g.12345  ORF Transcript_5244/g.12345 Transcript_5244/m.12345 type:complete len:139 (-) Transcript_5244:336-752(-)